MVFWVIAGGAMLAVGGLLLTALLRTREAAGPAAAHDMQVYRDQLAEVERDLARGVVTEGEAGRVRLEVSRRLLEADKSAAAAEASGEAPRALSLVGAGAIALVVVVGAAAFYAWKGAPGYPDLPLKQRIAAADQARAERPSQAMAEASMGEFTPPQEVDPKFLELMDRLRAAVAENPDDLRGQMLLTGNEARLGNYAAAHPAQAKVIELKGSEATAEDYATLTDLLVLAAGGFVSPEAEEALNEAIRRDPGNGPARYYGGLMYVQSGRPDLGFSVWRRLLSESRPEAPWVPPITAQIERVAQLAGVSYTPPESVSGAPGPSAGDVQAAEDMTPEERQEMIRNMVGGLEERLQAEGGTPEEWARLINALGVMGETERAATAWELARAAHGAHPPALETIRVAARSAGVAE